MISSSALLLFAALSIPATVSSFDEGQGTAKPGSTTAQLRTGSHLMGPAFRAEQQLGRVVILEIGGS